MPRVLPALAIGFLATFASAAACACGSARPTFDGSVYRTAGVAFRVPAVPAGWKRVDVTDAALAFRDDAHEGSILVNARCGEKDGDAPLLALTNQLVMGTTERNVTLEETSPFDGREIRHTKMTAKLDGVLLAYDIFVMKKDGCVYDFVYVAAPEKAAGGAPVFEAFVQGFHTLRGDET